MKSKPMLVDLDALLDRRHEAPERLAVLAGRLGDAGDRVGEDLVAELAGNAERHRQIEMADPKAIDAVDRRHRVGVLDALRRLDLAEQRGAAVGGRELVGDGAGR